MDKALLSWAVQEFGYVPVSSSSSTDTTGLRKLCSGSLQPYWKYVTTHVKSDIETLKIKGNLKLYHRKLQHQEPSKSSLNIEDQTLSERDMLIKELKDINFLSKKCREKGSKVRAEIAQNTKAYHTLKSSYDSRECLVDSQMKHLNFLNLLSESYTEKISGEKLNQLSADSKALTGYCGELTSNGKVNSKAPSMNRLYTECVEVLKAATSNPKEPVKTADPSLIATCFQDCDNNPDIIVNNVALKIRNLSQRTRGLDQNNALPEIEEQSLGISMTLRVLESWREDHVTVLKSSTDLEKQVSEQEKNARIASERAKQVLKQMDTSNEKKAAVLKLVLLHEKRARLSAALADLKQSLETAKNCGMKSAKVADPITTQKTRIESLKSALMHKQRTINLLNERNLGFQLKIKKLQDFTRSLAQQQSLGLAKDVGNQLITLNQALLASRLSFFKLSSNPLTLNVTSLTPKRHNFQQACNAAICLKQCVEDKNTIYDLTEFLRQASPFEDTKSDQTSAFNLLLEHAQTDPLIDVITSLDHVLKQMMLSRQNK